MMAVRTMALDYGERRVGVAVTDPLGLLAQPLESIERSVRADPLFRRLAVLVREYEVGEIVVGLPLHMDGASGEQAARARAFGEQVEKRTGIAVGYLDERWTSREAERVLGAAGHSPGRQRRKRARTDPVAAALILRTWLDRKAGP